MPKTNVSFLRQRELNTGVKYRDWCGNIKLFSLFYHPIEFYVAVEVDNTIFAIPTGTRTSLFFFLLCLRILYLFSTQRTWCLCLGFRSAHNLSWRRMLPQIKNSYVEFSFSNFHQAVSRKVQCKYPYLTYLFRWYNQRRIAFSRTTTGYC